MRNLIAMLAGLAGACAAGCGAAEPAGDGMTLQVYDVRDLRTPIDFPGMDFPGTDVKLDATSTPPAADAPLPDDAGTIAAALRALPGLDWAAPRALEAKAGTLIVRQDAPGHARIADWLRACRAACARLVAVEAWFLARPGEPKESEAGLHALADSAGEELLADTRRDTGATMICAPHLTLFDGQQGNISILNQLSYVAEYEAAAVGAEKPDPVVKHVDEGQVLEIRGAIGDGGRVRLDVAAQMARIRKPIATRETPHGPVQTPEVASERRTGAVTLEDGGWALLAGLREQGDAGPTGRRIDVLLRTRLVNLVDVTGPAPSAK